MADTWRWHLHNAIETVQSFYRCFSHLSKNRILYTFMTKPKLFLSYTAVTFPLLFNSHLCSPLIFQLYLDASFLSALSFTLRFYVETEVSHYPSLSEVFTHGYRQIK